MELKRPYDTTYIVLPDLSADDYAAILQKFNKLLADNGAEIVNQEVWGLRKLAYPIKKKQHGYYVYTEILAPGTFIEKLEREYIYDERIIRSLTVALDKHAVAFNLRRRNKQNLAVAEAQ